VRPRVCVRFKSHSVVHLWLLARGMKRERAQERAHGSVPPTELATALEQRTEAGARDLWQR
jgi:hypothetical protein